MKKMRKNFTLIELLVVVGLASLLMGIMLPAFNRLISGNAVDRAASELKMALEHAQSIAVSSRKYTAIILPSGSSWSTSEQKARLGGYRFCFVDDYTDTTEAAVFQRWTPESEWKMPTQGARLLHVANKAPEKDKNEPYAISSSGIFKLTDTTSKLVPETLSLLSDTEKRDTACSLKTISKYDGGETQKIYCAIVFSPYGEMKNDSDAYLTIGETQVSSGNLLFPGSSSDGPVNIKMLHINRITGAVEYYQP